MTLSRFLVQAIYIYASAAILAAAAFVPHYANVNVNPFLQHGSCSGSGSVTKHTNVRKHQMAIYSSYDKNNNNNNLDDYSGFFDDEFNRITGSSNSNNSNSDSDYDQNYGSNHHDYHNNHHNNHHNKKKRERDIPYQYILDIDNDIKPDDVYIILFNPDTDREGVHTIEFPKESGNNMILAFESQHECQQFSASLKEQQFFDPTPQQMNLEALENYCAQIGVEVQVIPEGMNLTPPKESVLNLGLNPNLEKEMKMLDYLFAISSSEEDDDDYIGEWE